MKKICTLLLCLYSTMMISTSEACTRILNSNNPNAVIIGRTMDWSADLATNLWIYPRGIEREGLVASNPIKWQSQYGSIIATAYDTFSTDGLNEKGLAAHILWLDETNYGERDPAKKGLSIKLWVQYYLDNFKNVKEAVATTAKLNLQIVSEEDPNTKHKPKLHLALEDASGDSAIIEYVQGKLHIYHDRTYTVLTNSPTYPQQLKNLQQYNGLGGDKPLPGSAAPQDRFVRAAYYLKYLPKTKSKAEAIAQTISIIRNVAEPYSDIAAGGELLEPTIWHNLADLSDQSYYFNASLQMNYVWTNLHNFNLANGASPLKLDLVNHPDWMGDVTKLFKPA